MLWRIRLVVFCLPLAIGCLASHVLAEQPPSPTAATLPAMAEIELTLAEWATDPGDAGDELSDSSVNVVRRVAELEKASKLAVVERLRLTTLEGTKAILQSRERVPVTQGVTLSRSGTMRNFVQKVIGTQVMLTLAKGTPGTVQMELSFERSRLVTDANAPPLAVTEQGEKILATNVATLKIETAVRVAHGKTAALAGRSSDGQHYVLLIAAAGAKQEK